MGAVGRDLYSKYHRERERERDIYIYILLYIYDWGDEHAAMLAIPAIFDVYWGLVLTHSQMAWRLTFDGCLLTSCPEASASKQFCFGRAHRNLMCQTGIVCFTLVFYWLEHCAHTILVVVCQRFFFGCVKKCAWKTPERAYIRVQTCPNWKKKIKLLLLSGTYLQFSYFEFIG